MKELFRYTNYWNWIAVFIGIQAFIGGYPGGLWEAIEGSILVAALVLLGRASFDRELEVKLRRVIDERTKELEEIG